MVVWLWLWQARQVNSEKSLWLVWQVLHSGHFELCFPEKIGKYWLSWLN
jgi:hypothetical protein